MSFSAGSGLVISVTTTQTSVVNPTVTSMIYAKSLGLSLSQCKPFCRKIETIAAVIIAETSDHALMRHQNQRNRSTVPVPAPVTSSSFHAPPIDSMKNVIITEAIISNTVTTCEATT